MPRRRWHARLLLLYLLPLLECSILLLLLAEQAVVIQLH